jgi:hypothetical protein
LIVSEKSLGLAEEFGNHPRISTSLAEAHVLARDNLVTRYI